MKKSYYSTTIPVRITKYLLFICCLVFGFKAISQTCPPPVANCQDITVYLDDNGNVSITSSQIDGGSSTDCNSTLSIDRTTFSCTDAETWLDYTVDETGIYNPIVGSGTVVIIGDDENSPPLPIGFPFKFYGEVYTQFNIASNGLMGFNLPFPAPNIAATGCCLGQLLPDPSTPNNLSLIHI